MDAVRQLIQKVIRGFYEPNASIVMDAILKHHVLTDRDLIAMMGLHAKDVRSICSRLKEDHLIKDINYKDDVPREQRAFAYTTYYIHFTEAVDAIKWKLYSVQEKLKEKMEAQHSPQDYICDVCKSRYSAIDAIPLFSPEQGIFVCEVCGNSLREAEGLAQDESNDQQSQLLSQLEPLIASMQRIDQLVVPENDFQTERQQAVPLYLEPEGMDGEGSQPLRKSAALPVPDQAKFEVHITSDAERAEQDRLAATERERLKEENALPEWHLHSTVGRSVYGSAASNDPRMSVKSEGDSVKLQDNTEEDAMDAYYKSLAAKQADGKPSQEEEDEDDEFEDVL